MPVNIKFDLFGLLDQLKQNKMNQAFQELINPPQVQGPPTPPTEIPPINLGGMGQTLPGSIPGQSPQMTPQAQQEWMMSKLGDLVNMGGPQILEPAMKFLQATGKIKDPILERQLKMEEMRQQAVMDRTKYTQSKIDARAKEKNLITGRLANSLIAYRQGDATPAQKRNILMDLEQQYRLELNDYYDNLKEFPMLQFTNPDLPPPVLPTRETVAANAGYDLNELKKSVTGKKAVVQGPPPPPQTNPEQTELNMLAKKGINKLNQRELARYRALRAKGLEVQK